MWPDPVAVADRLPSTDREGVCGAASGPPCGWAAEGSVSHRVRVARGPSRGLTLRSFSMAPEEPLFESIQPAVEAGPSRGGTTEPLAPVSESPETRVRPTPHKSKLEELLNNRKVPVEDAEAVQRALNHYKSWIGTMKAVTATGEEKVRQLVQLLNAYKRNIELDLIWESDQDFLFRQRGQLKIDNSIIEEFLPWLVDIDIIPELRSLDVFAGPAGAFAAAYFVTTLTGSVADIGLRVRKKDQDFTLSRKAFLKASFDPKFPAASVSDTSVWLAYVAAECKTNLDKTMFQEASATSHDLKVAIPGSRYYLLCEYLDMTPISTAGTDIDEVLILRGKRLNSNMRSAYASSSNRRRLRDEYVDFIERNPVREDVVLRFVEHLRSLFTHSDPNENDAVVKGYF